MVIGYSFVQVDSFTKQDILTHVMWANLVVSESLVKKEIIPFIRKRKYQNLNVFNWLLQFYYPINNSYCIGFA